MYFEKLVLVSIGGVLGSVVRLYLLQELETFLPTRYWRTCVINTVASFGLGFLVSIHQQMQLLTEDSSIFFLIGVGFLGSMSTFSSFILEVFQYLLNNSWVKAILLTALSISLGLSAAAVGFKLAQVNIF